MTRGNIELNSVGYMAVPFARAANTPKRFMHVENIPNYLTQIDLAGPNSRQNPSVVQQRTFSGFQGGVGTDRIPTNRDDEEELFARLWDSSCETRWGDVRLGVLHEALTTPTNGEVIRASAIMVNDLYSVWDRDGGAAAKGVIVSQYVSGDWSGNTTVYDGTTNETVALDLVEHLGRLHCLLASTNDHLTRYSNLGDAATWNTPTTEVTANLLANSVAANENTSFGKLASIGGLVVAVLFGETDSTIRILSSPTGDVYTSRITDIPGGGGGVAGVAVYPDTDGIEYLWVWTETGLYRIDTTAWTWERIPDAGLMTDTAITTTQQRQTIVLHTGQKDHGLYFAPRQAASGAPRLTRMTNKVDSREFDYEAGLDTDNGVPTEAVGTVDWLHSAYGQLFAITGGNGASRNARIYALKDGAWHNVYRHGTANQRLNFLAVMDDDILFGVRTSTSATATYKLASGMVDPNVVTGIKYQTTGYIDLPRYNGGLLDTGAFLRAIIEADDLSSSTAGEYVECHHGLNGAVRTTTDLGDFLSATTTLDYNGGLGEQGVSDANRLVLNRDGGDNTDTPIVRGLTIKYEKKPVTLRRFVFMIDLQASADLEENKSTEAVITALTSLEDAAILATFTYGPITQTQVRVTIDWGFDLLGEGLDMMTVPNSDARRNGTVIVTAEEKL